MKNYSRQLSPTQWGYVTMSNRLCEDNLLFDFACDHAPERFDIEKTNPRGMKSVDFVSETADTLYFIEVKDFQHPKATEENKKERYEMLMAAIRRRKSEYKMLVASVTDYIAFFPMDMGQKIKDSLLRKYAQGDKITKNIVYLLLINLDKLGASERLKLYDKIVGYIPTGLNDSRYSAFTNITFDIVDIKGIAKYGVTCSAKK